MPHPALIRKLTALTILAGLVALAAGTAPAADTQWEKDHPRREQVNHRLAKENARIKEEVKEGKLSKPQAAALHQDVHQIRKEEQLMASQNGSHITKAEQKVLNQQENAVSRQIGK